MLIEVRQDWLDQVDEEVIDPGRRIVDPHHHFFVENTDFPHYELADLRADAATHDVLQTVYVQCGEGYRRDGPEALRAVGETAWVDAIAVEARKQPQAVQIGAIIGTAELRLGAAVREVLEAHQAASALFRGIRQMAAWDASDALVSMPGLSDARLYDEADFRAGFAVLDDMGLVFDAYHYHPQTESFIRLARAFPGVSMVLDHLGTPLGVGPYAGRDDAVRAQWKRELAELALCENVTVKLGGLVMPWCGFGFERQTRPPTSDELVARQADYYHYAIEVFGPARCMFESNFPVDKCAVSYRVLWNAFKKIAARYSEAEQDAMFRGTATRVYRL